jgi:hypothetical protein
MSHILISPSPKRAAEWKRRSKEFAVSWAANTIC